MLTLFCCLINKHKVFYTYTLSTTVGILFVLNCEMLQHRVLDYGCLFFFHLSSVFGFLCAAENSTVKQNRH